MKTPSDQERVPSALSAVFLGAGLLLGSWASRTPAVAGALHVDATVVSSFVIALAGGSALGLLVATRAGRRIGPRAGVRSGVVLQFAGLAGIGIAAEGVSSVPATVLAVFVFGTGVGLGDVLMNVEAAGAEQIAGRSVLPRLHAMFSLGAMAGAAIGGVSAGIGLPISVQFPAVAVIGTAAVLVAAGRFSGPTMSTVSATVSATVVPEARRGAPVGSVARRLLLIALTVLGLAFAEGTATSWISLGAVRGHGLDAIAGAVAYGVFVTAMTATRFVGGWIVDRVGRAAAIRLAIGTTVLGLLLFAFAPGVVGVVFAALLWGAGCALGVPLGVSAAADGGGDPRRVAVVSATAYTGALALPALLGPLFDRWGYGVALIVPIVVLVAGLAVSRVFQSSARVGGAVTDAYDRLVDLTEEQLVAVFKALGHPKRLEILDWLRDPDSFPVQDQPAAEVGVCLKHITARAEVSQSTASEYMAILHRADLVTVRRIAQWAHYKRNEPVIAAVAAALSRVD